MTKRTQSDKVLKGKASAIARNPKYDGYQRGLASMVYKFFDETLKGSGIKNEIIENQQLANELHKPIIKKFKKKKGEIEEKEIVPLKEKKDSSIVNAFQSILDSSKGKPQKIWVDQGSEFYKSFKKWLKYNNVEIYSIHNEGKSVAAERFIINLKNKIYKHMAAVSKNVYFDVLDDIVDKYNNTYHRTINLKPIDVKSDSFAEYNEKSNEKDPKLEVGDHVRV